MSEAKLYRIGNMEKTLTEWSKFYCQPFYRVYNRMSKLGWTLEEALTTPKMTERGQLLTVGNVTRTLRWWSKKNGVPRATINARMAAGMTPEQIVSPLDLRERLVTLGGTTKAVGEWLEEKGIEYRTVYYRTAVAGMTIEAALTMPVAPNGRRRKGSR